MKFITLNGLNRNLKDFYANIVKPEIKKNAGTGSNTTTEITNNVALIENNKIIGGGPKTPYSYKAWIDNMLATSTWQKVEDYIYTDGYTEGEGGVIVLIKLLDNGQRFLLDYCMVAPQDAIESTVNSSGMFDKEEYVDFQAHTESVDGVFDTDGYPPGNFMIKTTLRTPEAEELQHLKQLFPEITAVYSNGKYLNLNFEEITPTEEDKIFLCMSGYYNCSLGEIRTRKEVIAEEDSLLFKTSDGTEENYYLYGGENGFIFNSGNIKIMPPEEGITAEQLAEKIIETKNSLRFYTKDFDTVEELENEKLKEKAQNQEHATFAFVNGTIYCFQKSDSTWFQIDYFAVSAEGEICNFVYPMADEFVLPAIEEIPLIENPTEVSGEFIFDKNIKLYNQRGEPFISTFRVYNRLYNAPSDYEKKDYTFSICSCSDTQLQECLKKISYIATTSFNEENFEKVRNEMTWANFFANHRIIFDTNYKTGNYTESINIEKIL